MSANLFKGVLIFGLWSRAKENPKIHKDPSKECKRLFDTLSRYQSFISVPDKRDILDSLIQDLSDPAAGLFTSGAFKDSHVLTYLERTLQGSTTDELREYLKTVTIFLFEDHQISPAEKENLCLFGDRFKISREDIERVIDEAKNSKDLKKTVVTHARIKTRQDKIVSMSLVGLGIFMILLTGLGVLKYLQAKQAIRGFDLGEYLEQSPRLVFQKVSFNKYIAYGTPPDANSILAKLYVYHVKGDADFQFNLKNLEIDKKNTDYVSRHLVLIYKYADPYQLPIEVDVNISQTDIHKIEELEARPISEDESKMVAKAVAVPAGLAGTIVGAKIGGIFKMPIGGNIVGGLIGAGVGGAAASTGAYVMTNQFLTGLQLRGNSLGEEEQILNSAKALIGMELTGGSMWNSEKWDVEIRQYYEKKLNNRLQEIFKAYGWETVKIEYPSFMDKMGGKA
jgi:hypothetical protein